MAELRNELPPYSGNKKANFRVEYDSKLEIRII